MKKYYCIDGKIYTLSESRQSMLETIYGHYYKGGKKIIDNDETLMYELK